MGGDLVKIGQISSSPRAQRVWLDGFGNTVVLPISDIWRTSLLADEALNDSDKTFTVPAATEYQILSIWVEFTSDSNVGNRQLVIEIQDSATDVIARWAIAGTVQAEDLVREYLFAPGVSDLAVFRDTSYLSTPIPATSFLGAGDIIRIYDNNAVAAGTDDMVVQMKIASKDV